MKRKARLKWGQMNAADEMVEVHAIVSGLVQGVGFRATACSIAQRMGLKGMARNLSDGNVEIIVQGQKTQLDLFFEKLQAETHGRVDSIDKTMSSLFNKFDSFSITNTISKK